MLNQEKSQFAKNQMQLMFHQNKTESNEKIIEEVTETIIIIASKYDTEITISFNPLKEDNYIEMTSTQNLTSNQYYSDTFFAFYQEFLDYTNEVEDKYRNFVTLPSR